MLSIYWNFKTGASSIVGPITSRAPRHVFMVAMRLAGRHPCTRRFQRCYAHTRTVSVCRTSSLSILRLLLSKRLGRGFCKSPRSLTMPIDFQIHTPYRFQQKGRGMSNIHSWAPLRSGLATGLPRSGSAGKPSRTTILMTDA